ncbi:MAG TPA: hypothetical protein VEJ20_02460 [Candidatus Eremiobacteraceae bacterium]|nr:hypothetical protein [Candidatus Eremiobacteraceae bacterium]
MPDWGYLGYGVDTWTAGFLILLLICVAVALVSRRSLLLGVGQLFVLGVAIGLIAYQWAWFGNRQAYGVATTGRTFDKIEIDECYGTPALTSDPAFNRDFEEALASTCTPWIVEHYSAYAAIVLATFGAFLVGARKEFRPSR